MSSASDDPRWRQLTLGLFAHAPVDFDTYFAGPNEEALRGVRSWAETAAGAWCVLLWGPPGSGKSHLLQAAVSAVDERGASCMYVPLREAQRFGPGIMDGLDSLQVLCVDDVEIVAGDKAWEEMLFALYNQLQASGRRLLLSANCAPQSLSFGLPDLRSRLSSALVYHLDQLGDDDKQAALIQAAGRRGLNLPEPVAAYLLRRLPRDWPGLSSALDRLDHASLSAGRALTVPFVREVLGLPD
jgi:DnaA family protein